MKPIWNVLVIMPFILDVYVLCKMWGWWRNESDPVERWFMICVPILCGLLVNFLLIMATAGIASGISSLIRNKTALVWHECWSGKMVSMRGVDGLSGSLSGGLFMISGRIGSEQMYSYYTLNSDGSFQPQQWQVNSHTRVYEEDRTDGEVHQFNVQLKNAYMSWFTEPDDRLKMEFHIPKGSIKQEFKLP